MLVVGRRKAVRLKRQDPKCRGVAPRNSAVHTALPSGCRSSSTPPTGEVNLTRRELRVEARDGRWEEGGGETGEIMKRCGAPQSTPTPPE